MRSELDERLRDELHRSAMGVVVEVSPPEGLVAVVRRGRRRRLTAASTIVLVVVLGLVGVVAAFRPATATDPTVVAGPDGAELVLTDPGPAELVMKDLPAAPLSAREDMSGVWTGNELIIWGGNSNGSLRSDGAAYEPRSRTWRQIAPSPLSARTRHMAVWTGREMIVWGGSPTGSGVGGLLDGAAYDPATDTWRTIADAPLGSDRTYATAAWVDNRAVFAGGGNGTGSGLGTVAIYDPDTDAWIQASAPGSIGAAAPVGRRLAVAVVDPATLRAGAVRLELLDVRTGGFEAAGRLPAPDPDARVSAMGLASDDGAHLVAAVAATGEDDRGRTTVAVLADGGAEWQAITTVPEDEFTPGGQQRLLYPPGLTAWTGTWLFGWSWAPTALAVGTTRTAEQPDDQVCGDAGVAVWTGTEVLQWGGQNCLGEGPLPQVDTGVSIRIVPTG